MDAPERYSYDIRTIRSFLINFTGKAPVMKKNQKITKIQLDLNNPDEFIIMGIVSAEPDYRVSLSINKKLGLSLKNITPVDLSGISSPELSFSRFSDASRSPELVYILVSNRTGNNFLVKKLKNIDYLFVIHDMESDTGDGRDSSLLISSLKEADHITAVFDLDIDIIGEKYLHHLII
jgi:hypothetical protein